MSEIEGQVQFTSEDSVRLQKQLKNRRITRSWLEKHRDEVFSSADALNKDYVVAFRPSKDHLQFFNTREQVVGFLSGQPDGVRQVAVSKYRLASESIMIL